MKHISICLILLMGLFVGCSDDDNSSDWTITMTVDLPQADTVALGFIHRADLAFRIDWGINSGETQYENKRYYSPGRYTITLNCQAWFGLGCSSSYLVALDVRQCPELGWLKCVNGQLTELDLSNQSRLGYLQCDTNQIAALDLSHCGELETLSCSHNNLSSLDVTRNLLLEKLCCNDNNLTEIKIGTSFDLEYVAIHNNPLSDEACNAIFNALPAKSKDTPGTILLDPDKGDVSILEAKNWIPTYPADDSNTNGAN